MSVQSKRTTAARAAVAERLAVFDFQPTSPAAHAYWSVVIADDLKAIWRHRALWFIPIFPRFHASPLPLRASDGAPHELSKREVVRIGLAPYIVIPDEPFAIPPLVTVSRNAFKIFISRLQRSEQIGVDRLEPLTVSNGFFRYCHKFKARQCPARLIALGEGNRILQPIDDLLAAHAASPSAASCANLTGNTCEDHAMTDAKPPQPPTCRHGKMEFVVIDLRGPMTLHTWICEACGVRKDELVPTIGAV